MNLIPSPQISEQVSFDVGEPPVHVQPDSILQVELQPSPVITFPSSQKVLNDVYFLPSAHISDQTSLDDEVPPDHIHPVSLAQVELHPSPETVFPSSQYVLNELNRLPSPHISVHASFEEVVPPDHIHPDSKSLVRKSYRIIKFQKLYQYFMNNFTHLHYNCSNHLNKY